MPPARGSNPPVRRPASTCGRCNAGKQATAWTTVIAGRKRCAIVMRFENALQRDGLRGQPGLGFDPVHKPGPDNAEPGDDGLETGLETVAAERR